jgi:type IV fimbrial biogenesis protein FimT
MIEMIVTMAVAGILTALAVPAFQSFIQNDRDITQINSLVLSLNYARSEAVKRNVATGITVCPSSDGATCNGTASWSNGWIVTDNLAPTPTVLQAVPALSGTNTVTSGAVSAVVFRSSGQVAPQLLVKVCDPRGATYARDVEVSLLGRVAASQTHGYQVDNVTPLVCP